VRQSERELALRNAIATAFLTRGNGEAQSDVLRLLCRALASPDGLIGTVVEEVFVATNLLSSSQQIDLAGKQMRFSRNEWRGLWGRTLIDKRPIYVNKSVFVPEGHIPVDCAVSVPILYQELLIGAITVANKLGGYTKADQQSLEQIAEYLAPLLHARLERDLKEKQRRVAEEALRRSEERYRLFFEANVIGTFISTPAGKILSCNTAFARMFGYESPWEVQQQDVMQLLPDHERRCQYLDQLVSERAVERFERIGQRKDGKKVFVNESAVGIFNEAGEMTEILGYVVDETARRNAEEQLRRAQRLEAVGRLSGGIAHDFNNILGVILGYSELMMERVAAPDPLLHQIEEIRKAADRASALTRQLLAFSRQQVMQPVVMNVNDAVGEMDKMLHRLLGEDIEIAVRLADNLGNIKADPSQMEQVLLNLAVNARDAMPKGGKLTIETENAIVDEAYATAHCDAVAGEYVVLAVTDTGVGMSPETQASIFEPFFTTKERGKGTGLGLATVYGIVKQSGGYIWVYSEVGHGTTFKVYLPVVELEKKSRLVARVGVLAKGSETLLLVEDSDPMRALSRSLLESAGYSVIEAPTPAEALEIIRSDPGTISLMITDVVMPGMSGRQLAEQIAPLRPEMQVLYVSGYTDDAVVNHGVLESGMAFLQKPFTREALTRKVRELLDRKLAHHAQ
jgi:two-component system, cell cycle sensor histidine kinase and response regulator CckA